MAVDQGSHDAFVVTATASGGVKGIVYRFGEDGAPDKFTEGSAAGTNKLTGMYVGRSPLWSEDRSQVAVAPPGASGGTAGDIYVASEPDWEGEGEGMLEVFTAGGSHIASIDGSGNPNPDAGGHLCGVAIDPGGSVYLSYFEPNLDGKNRTSPIATHVDKYVPTSDPITNSDFDSEITGLNRVCNLAAGSQYLYGIEANVPPTRYALSHFPGSGGSSDASGAAEGFGSGSAAVAVDPSNEDVYLATETTSGGAEGQIKQFDKNGSLLSKITIPDEARGVAVDGASGRVFVSNGSYDESQDKVRVYGPGVAVEPPTATLDPVTAFNYKSAHLAGTVNSGGEGEYQQTTYRFQCSPECPGLQGEREVPADGADHEVSDDTSGLEPETAYEVTLLAENEGGKSEASKSFETPPKPAAEAPEVTIDAVGAHTATTAHVSGAVNPRGEGELQETDYRFEYTSDGVIWKVGPEQGPIEGEGFQGVSTELEGLEPNTSYSVRLRAENVGGAVTSAGPNPSFNTDPAAPLVEVTGATGVLASSAQLNGRVNARNADTTYYFQWGEADCASHPCASVPVSEDAGAGSGGSYVWVDRAVSGLSPSTAYHYRLLAKGPGGEAAGDDATFSTAPAPAACPNEVLRVGASAKLPDCRAYEMVSPLDKNGADIPANPTRTRSAADGDAVSYAASAGFAGAPGVADAGAEYLSSRGPDGWATHPLTPPQAAPAFPHAFTGSTYVGGFSPNLDSGVFQGLAPIPGVTTPNVEGVPNLYLATGMRSGYPSFTLLSDAVEPVPPVAWENSPHIHVAATSADFSHVLFESTDRLTPDAGEGRNLYEFAGGKVRLAAIFPDSACGSPPCPAAESSVGALTSNGGSNFDSGTYSELAHPISADGSRVFFTAGDPLKRWRDIGGADEGFAGSLYLREDGSRTVQVDASERSTPDPKGPGRSEFQMATPDGKVVYFLSKQELVDADTDGEGISLYRYDVEAPAGERLTLMPTAGAIPKHVVGIGDGGAFVYFTATSEDLHVIHAGEARLIATRSAGGEPNLGEGGTNSQRFANAARVSPDGRRILFGSRANLTGYDPHNPDFEPGPENDLLDCADCAELYVYSYDSGELQCTSCNPSGAPPSFDATFMRAINAGTTFFPSAAAYTNTPFSRDGRYTFFTSLDPLVEADTNGKLDAYVYDSESGEVRLLSSGQCNCDSVFLTASPDGHDAFFTTRERLVRADTDELNDIYDARVDGGIAAQNALPPAECQGDACQASPSAAPSATPASAGFAGPGNARPRLAVRRRCPKGKRRVRRAGKSRCVRKRRHRHRHRRHRHRGSAAARAAKTNRGGAR